MYELIIGPNGTLTYGYTLPILPTQTLFGNGVSRNWVVNSQSRPAIFAVIFYCACKSAIFQSLSFNVYIKESNFHVVTSIYFCFLRSMAPPKWPLLKGPNCTIIGDLFSSVGHMRAMASSCMLILIKTLGLFDINRTLQQISNFFFFF